MYLTCAAVVVWLCVQDDTGRLVFNGARFPIFSSCFIRLSGYTHHTLYSPQALLVTTHTTIDLHKASFGSILPGGHGQVKRHVEVLRNEKLLFE